MTTEFVHICANCNFFHPDTFDWTEHGICLADEAFALYLDDLLEHGNFESCQQLIQAKRFLGEREGCSLYEEAEITEFDDDFPREIVGRLPAQKAGEVTAPAPQHSFQDHSYAWLMEHDEVLRDLRRKFAQSPAEERRMAADYEYHAGAAGQLFSESLGESWDPHAIPGEVVALAIDPTYAPALLTLGSLLAQGEREVLFNAFLSVCQWVNVYYAWRPNLQDEADNHLIELAVAGGAGFIVTKNIKDFRNAELIFPGIKVVLPENFLQEVQQCRH